MKIIFANLASKGISPFIAIILAIAFVVGVGGLLGIWMPSLLTTQTETVEPTVETAVSCGAGWFDLKYTKACGDNLKRGLVLWLRLDDGSGTTASDSSGYGNDGTVYNGSVSCANPPTAGAGCPEWVDGKIGKALSFDGVDDYVKVPDSASLQNLLPASYEVWVKGVGMVITKSVTATIRQVLIDPTYNWAEIRIFVPGIDIQARSVDNAVDPTQWTHIVGVVYEDLTARLWINGNEVTYAIQTTGAASPPDDTGEWIAIGKRPYENTGHFNGTIDEVRIYNRALSEDEIKALYYEGLANKFNITFTMLNKGTTSLGSNFTATVFLSNGTNIKKNFNLDTTFAPASVSHQTLVIDGYYPSYGLIDELKVCSRACPGICSKITDDIEC